MTTNARIKRTKPISLDRGFYFTGPRSGPRSPSESVVQGYVSPRVAPRYPFVSRLDSGGAWGRNLGGNRQGSLFFVRLIRAFVVTCAVFFWRLFLEVVFRQNRRLHRMCIGRVSVGAQSACACVHVCVCVCVCVTRASTPAGLPGLGFRQLSAWNSAGWKA
jgi:hypothetical protein